MKKKIYYAVEEYAWQDETSSHKWVVVFCSGKKEQSLTFIEASSNQGLKLSEVYGHLDY